MEDLSRRSFVELVCGSLVTLPTLAGGLVLAPRPAYADADATDIDEVAGRESEYVVIDVVEPYEVGFIVVDVSKGKVNDAGMVSYPPVEGAEVTVKSRFNGKTVSRTTHAKGVANIDIRQLSVNEDGEDVNNLDSYYFNGSVSVEKDGWRSFETACMAVEGGGGLQVPAHPLDGENNVPYPRLVSFDEWDALYIKNDFSSTPANQDNHEIKVSIMGFAGDKAATVELWVEGEEFVPRQSAQATFGEPVAVKRMVQQADGRSKEVLTYATPATATFGAHFLKTGDPEALPVGGKFKLAFVQDGKTYAWPLAFTVSEGVVDEPSDKQNVSLAPFNTTGGAVQTQALATQATTGLNATWPGDAPLVGGGNLNFWMPELPVGIYVNPFGMVQITLKSPSWGYLNDGGASDKSGWGKYPRKTIEQQWDKKTKILKTMTDKTSGLMSKPGAVQQIDLFKSFSIMVNFQLLALAKWNSDKGVFQGEVAGQIVAGANFTITENFFAGPIPVLITFSLDASLIFALSAAATSARKNKDEQLLKAIGDMSRWEWDYTNTGFTMTFNITPSLSVGVGLRGVASISVKGAITLTLFFGVPMGTQPDNLPSPHFAAGWSAQISLVIELFLFTHSFSLYNKPFSNFYDNWNGEGPAAIKTQAEQEVVNALAGLSVDDLLDQMTPITDDMLATTSEGSVSAQDQETLINWDAIATEAEGQLADGTPIVYTVYDLSQASSASLAAQAGGGSGHGALMAGSSPDLVPQEADAAAREANLLSVMSSTDLPNPGVAALGAMGGIRPSSDMRLFGTDDSHVFGSAHAKVVELSGRDDLTPNHDQYAELVTGTWCFRIAAVQVAGKMRTRLVANCIDGTPKGATRIIEFSTGIEGMPHDELYDYDFDLGGGAFTNYLDIVIVSGRRQDSSLASAATDLVFTSLCIRGAFFVGGDEVIDASSFTEPGDGSCYCRKGSEVINYKPNAFHSILSLQLTHYPAYKEHAMITFLDRCADTAEEVLGTSAEVRIGILFSNFSGGAFAAPNQSSLGALAGNLSDTTAYEQTVAFYKYDDSDTNSQTYTLMVRGAEKCHYLLLSVRAWIGGSALRSVKRCEDYDASIRLVPCPRQGYSLTSYPDDPAQLELPPDKRDYSKWTLHKTTWTDDATPKLNVEPIGPTGFNVVNFAVNPRGTFIFWPQTRDADEDRVWGADGEEDVKTRPAVYQLMACRIRGNHFSDPFVVADLAHDTDALEVLSVNSSAAVEALRTEYVDTGTRDAQGRVLYHAADIWYTSVPPVRCATATACEAENPFVMPGGKIKFHVAVRNDGNVFLSGCTLALCACNESTGAYERVPGASANVTFGKDTICESHYNQPDGKGGLTGLEDDYALAPGKTSVYAVTVTVPTSWKSGEKKVLFVASDGVQAPDSALSTQSAGLYAQAEGETGVDEPEAVEFHIEPGDYKVVQTRTAPADVQDPDQRHMETLHVAESGASGDFSSAPVTAPDAGAGSPESDDARGTSASNPNRSTAPNTGDAFPLGLLGAALVAAGVATAAYERRRAENDCGEEN
ncbi:MAG: hypothetical protein IJ087_09335 [Eggerthellaceae bacterium]|nr:hypothetical protein [Eggerthellaceae bacterium]